MKKATRIKAQSLTLRYQSRDEVELAIKQLGDLQREIESVSIEQNNRIAQITEEFAPAIANLQEKIKPMQQAIQTWCESNRDELTNNGKSKTANFNTGEVQWRQRPPSVSVRGVSSVIENIKTLNLFKFLRIKEEINKEAMLNEPELAGTIAGITIKKGVEDFVITPFEQEIK